MSDHIGAKLLSPVFPQTKALIADKGYHSNAFRAELKARRITPGIPPKRNRRTVIPFNKALYRPRHKIENMSGRIKDWRRVATRYDRCAHTFFSAICRAATVIFWL